MMCCGKFSCPIHGHKKITILPFYCHLCLLLLPGVSLSLSLQWMCVSFSSHCLYSISVVIAVKKGIVVVMFWVYMGMSS